MNRCSIVHSSVKTGLTWWGSFRWRPAARLCRQCGDAGGRAASDGVIKLYVGQLGYFTAGTSAMRCIWRLRIGSSLLMVRVGAATALGPTCWRQGLNSPTAAIRKRSIAV